MTQFIKIRCRSLPVFSRPRIKIFFSRKDQMNLHHRCFSNMFLILLQDTRVVELPSPRIIPPVWLRLCEDKLIWYANFKLYSTFVFICVFFTAPHPIFLLLSLNKIPLIFTFVPYHITSYFHLNCNQHYLPKATSFDERHFLWKCWIK